MSVLFPPQAQRLADVLAAHGLLVPVDLSFLLGAPLNFFYVRGPHLMPPHQIAGLSPMLVLACLRRLEFQTTPLPEEGLEVVLAEGAALDHLPRPVTPERIGWPAGKPCWIVATRPEPVARRVEQAANPAAFGWQVLVPPATAPAPEAALPAALAETAYGMMICSGAWQGVDGIEYWSEDLVRWALVPTWPESAATAAQGIAASDGLWRRAFASALSRHEPAAGWAGQWHGLADEWGHLGEGLVEAARTGRADRLEKLSRVVLRLAQEESRAWGRLIDAFGGGI